MQYPRDVELIETLVVLSDRITHRLDGIVLNTGSDDPALQKLAELAQKRITWPTLVRPGDPKFTQFKLGRLKVGNKAGLGSLPEKAKRVPSLATDINRLTLTLIGGLTDGVESVLYVSRNREEASRTLLGYGFPESEHAKLLSILARVECDPFSKKTLRSWSGILADYVLLVGPERFPELRSLLKRDNVSWDEKSSRSAKRSKLQNFFNQPLKRLAGIGQKLARGSSV
jgi:hypothetical protein